MKSCVSICIAVSSSVAKKPCIMCRLSYPINNNPYCTVKHIFAASYFCDFVSVSMFFSSTLYSLSAASCFCDRSAKLMCISFSVRLPFVSVVQ